MTRFVIVPQWQGSPSSRAMQLIDGAQAIAGDLPRAACTMVEVPLEAGEAVGTGIHRFTTLSRTRGLVDDALAGIDEPAMVVGGDCGVAVGAVAHAATRHPSLAVVWLDAHPDLHTPATSPSGAFGGMALRAVLGDGAEGLALAAGTIDPSRVVLCGAREYDDAEESAVAAIRVVEASSLADRSSLADAVESTGATAVYVHVDLDVLDPAAFTGVTSTVPFGLQVAELVGALAELRARVPLAGSSIAGFAPSSPAAAVDDLGAILRIVGALA
jgi:arginase